jgi:hypothetical protein
LQGGIASTEKTFLVKRLGFVFAIFSVTQSFQFFAPFRPFNGPAHVYRPASWRAKRLPLA